MSCGERALQLVVDHGVAAVLDDDGPAVEALQPGQRLDRASAGLAAASSAVRLGRGRAWPAVLMTSTPCSRGRSRAVRSLVQMVAVSVAGVQVDARSCTSRPAHVDLGRGPRRAAPSRQTQTPLMATSSRSGSKAAAVVPTAASTRPQLGSSPRMAHLSRLLRATARPTSTASSSVAAPTTSIAIVLGGALGVGDQLLRPGRAQTAVTASANSLAVGADAGGAGGQQQHGVVGGHAAVGVDPVEGDAGRGAQRRVERRRRRRRRRW